jgi:hypothetical protein
MQLTATLSKRSCVVSLAPIPCPIPWSLPRVLAGGTRLSCFSPRRPRRTQKGDSILSCDAGVTDSNAHHGGDSKDSICYVRLYKCVKALSLVAHRGLFYSIPALRPPFTPASAWTPLGTTRLALFRYRCTFGNPCVDLSDCALEGLPLTELAKIQEAILRDDLGAYLLCCE